jgi:hypothetical protein
MARVSSMRLAVTAALLAALALQVGCGDDEETTTPTSAESETTSAPETTVEDDAGAPGDKPTSEPPVEAAPPIETRVSSPEKALELFFTSGDPKIACDLVVTPDLLADAYGDAAGCRQAQVPAATPDSIEIKSVDGSGNEAEATVIPAGGPNDGIETKVTLVKLGDTWLVDSLEADVPAGP